MKLSNEVPDVNYHLTNKCNMKCRFCFAQFKDVNELNKDESIKIVRKISDFGFKKINFVGGEPTLYPWLSDLILEAKNAGMTTSIVTNGSRINEEWLETNIEYLDWLGFSIDSLIPEINQKLGRCFYPLGAPGYEFYYNTLLNVKRYDVKIKINTVVTSKNKDERFHRLISEIRPDKWKIFQVLILKGENSEAKDLAISRNEFEMFLVNHIDLQSKAEIFPEYNHDMIGSYIMIDPAGRFFDNTKGFYSLSENILKVGVKKALNQITIDPKKFSIRQDLTRINNIVTQLNQ